MATGVINSITTLMLSPGMTISVPSGSFDDSGDISRAEIELRTITIEKRRMTAAFFFGQNVGLGVEIGVRRNAARFSQYLPALDFFTFGAAQQNTDIIASLPFIQQLSEHFDAGRHRLLRGLEADDLDFLANFNNTALHTTGNDRATTANCENVLDRHKKRLVDSPHRFLDKRIYRVHEL